VPRATFSAELSGRTSSPEAELYVERPLHRSTWDGMQRPHGGVPIAVVQAFADKTLVNHRGRYACPLRLALLNVDREVQTQGLAPRGLAST
jgi:hypothetical protein